MGKLIICDGRLFYYFVRKPADKQNVVIINLPFTICRPDNYDVYLRDIFRQRLEIELEQPNPLDEKTFFQLALRQRVELLQQLCNFRLDADDVFELLKVREP